MYYLLVGATCVGGGFYAYRTIKGDKERYQERINEIASRPNKVVPEQPITEAPGEQAAETPQEIAPVTEDAPVETPEVTPIVEGEGDGLKLLEEYSPF